VTGLPRELRAVTTAEVAERLAAGRCDVAFLLYRDGEARQRIVELAAELRSLCIGRGPACEIALSWDAEVSRVHAMLERTGDHWTVADDGLSRNGSFVNGRRLRGRQRLADGDTIGVGRTLLVFAGGPEPALRITETARDSAPPELSPAQQRVLTALCRALAADPFSGAPSNREIAEELYVSVETVKSHMRVLFERFGVEAMPQNRKRTELARRALERGAVAR